MTDKKTDQNGRFLPGNGGGPGRPRGSPNRTTAEIRAALLEVFVLLQADEGKPYALTEWAKANPDRFYPLAARLVPSETRIDARHSHRRDGDLTSYSTAELEEIVRRGEEEIVTTSSTGA